MHSRTVEYVDFDDVKKSTVVWFHLTQTRALENLQIAEDMSAVQRIFEAPKHDLPTSEMQMIVNFVRDIIRLSYGKRLDNNRFRQNDEEFQDFRDSAVYDAFFSSLFIPDPAAVLQFANDVVPPNLFAELRKNQQETRSEPSNAELAVTSGRPDLDGLSAEQLRELLEAKQNSQ